MTTQHSADLQPLRWQHPIKKRYYYIFLAQDLLGDWIITRSWGGISTSLGRVSHVACTSLVEAKKLIDHFARARIRQGYILR